MSEREAPSLRAVCRRLLAYPLPADVGWPHVLGGLLLASLAVQLVTGALLALYYSPSASDAWESVRYVEEEVRAGSVIRGVHHFGSSAFVVLALLHALRTFVWGAYKGARRWTWVVGCLLLGCVLAFGFTGYLLPWDERAFFGTRVGVEIAASAPLVGDALRRLLAGGPAVGELTLPRFYAAHAVVLPLVTVGLVALHLVLLRLHGPTRGWRAAAGPGRAFHPYQLAKDAAAALVLVVGLVLAGRLVGAPLGERADPLATDVVPRPEWYFLGAQQLLRVFSGRWELVGSLVLPAAAALVLVLLPWLDRGPATDPRRRPLAMAAGGLALAAVVGLTAWGWVELDAEEHALEARLAALEAAEEEGAAAAAAEDGEPEPAPAPDLDPARLRSLGRALARELACDSCHAEEARGLVTPDLAIAGDRARPEWLRAYLRAPTRLRFETEGEHPLVRMPAYLLADDELEALALHLETLRDPERVPPIDLPASASPVELERGRVLFEELDCRACHALDGDGEEVGPHLDAVGGRRPAAYLHAIVTDPERVVPGTSMPPADLDEDETRALVLWLRSLR